MKNTFIFLAFFCFFSGAILGQNKGQRVDRLHKATNNHVLSMALKYPQSSQISLPEMKSTSVIKQKLDTVIYESYDDSTGILVKQYKDEYQYDTFGRQKQVIWWYCERGDCVPEYKDEFSYDSNGNKSLYSSYTLDSASGDWILYYKEEYFYDTGNSLIRTIESYLDELDNVWISTGKTDRTYDADKNLLTETDFDWDEVTNSWANNFKHEYDYDHGKLVREISHNWNDSTGIWEYSNKSEYSYDIAGNQTLQVEFSWNLLTSQWDNTYKYEYTYNSNGKLTREIEYDWDMYQGMWMAWWQDEYTWDAYGNLAMDFEYFNKDSTGQWDSQFKLIYSYDNSVSQADLVLPLDFFPLDFFNHKLLTMSGLYLVDSTNQWLEEELVTFKYSEINIGGIPEVSIADIRVFPNPVSDMIRIESDTPMISAKFELNDIQGRKILSEDLTGTRKTISVGNLPAGVYFYQIIKQGKINRGKILIR